MIFITKRSTGFSGGISQDTSLMKQGGNLGTNLPFLLSVSRKNITNPGLDYAISIFHMLRFQMLLKRAFFSRTDQIPEPLILRVAVKISLTSGLVKTVWKGQWTKCISVRLKMTKSLILSSYQQSLS